MLSERSSKSDASRAQQLAWLEELLDVELPREGGRFEAGGQMFVLQEGIPSALSTLTESQNQTSKSFGFQWQKENLFDQPEVMAQVRGWLFERYGRIAEQPWWADYGENPLVLDAGCGAALSGIELFGEMLNRCRYIGADVSEAVHVACKRFSDRNLKGAFIRSDLNSLPLPADSVDVIFSEGVLHHTDSTERALKNVVRHLKPGGRFLFYVYRKKGPIREYSDDFIREKLRQMDPQDAWNALLPLSKLGKALGDLNVEVDVPEDVELLAIPKGRINLQRLFYWHIFKAYYKSDWSVEQMNNTNFDWYAPTNAHRQTPEEVRQWCHEAGLEVEKEYIDDAGITMIARKTV